MSEKSRMSTLSEIRLEIFIALISNVQTWLTAGNGVLNNDVMRIIGTSNLTNLETICTFFEFDLEDHETMILSRG